jgi:PAS domain S-box-containing protein
VPDRHGGCGVVRLKSSRPESSVWWRTLFELAPDACFLVGGDGVLLDWNPAAEHLTLLERDEVVGKPFHRLPVFHSSDRETVRNAIVDRLADRDIVQRDYLLERHDGSSVIVEPRSHRITLGDEVVLFGSARDVTERRKVEDEARRNTARLSRAQRAARIGAWEFDLRTGVVWWSDEMYRLFARDPEAWSPNLEEFFDAIIPEDKDLLPSPTSPPDSSDKPYSFTARFEVTPGTIRHLRVEGFVDCDTDGNPVQMLGTTQDVTDHMVAATGVREHQHKLRELASQIALAEERERHRIAGDLHDRTIQMLALSQIKLGALKNALHDDTRLSQLVDEVRTFVEQSIRDTRSLLFELSPPVLHELGFAAAVESLAELVTDEHALDCTVRSSGKPLRLGTDVEVSLFQAVREALINTVKHAHASHAVVTLDWSGPDALSVCVEDDGAGFDVGELESRRSHGNGFGLFSMRERLGVLGGHAEVSSRRGGGTRVRLQMPLSSFLPTPA